MRTYRKNVCGICPKYKAWVKDTGNCLVRGGTMLRVHPACEWGKKFIHNEYAKLKMREYRERDKKKSDVAKTAELGDSVHNRGGRDGGGTLPVHVCDVD